jgi:hypothetical protein
MHKVKPLLVSRLREHGRGIASGRAYGSGGDCDAHDLLTDETEPFYACSFPLTRRYGRGQVLPVSRRLMARPSRFGRAPGDRRLQLRSGHVQRAEHARRRDRVCDYLAGP